MNRPKCKCGNPVGRKGITNAGTIHWQSACDNCRYAARKHKKDFCQECGYKPRDKAKLDIDHINGDRSNNEIENLRTLCKPCHKIKTIENGDHLKNRRYKK